MKNIIVTIILISGLQVNAQYIIPVEQMTTYLLNHNYENHYFKDVNGVLNKFVGNWKYETTSEKLEIEIYKLENINNGGGSRYQDEIELRFRYTINGIVMFDTFNSNTNLYIIGLRFDIPTNTNISVIARNSLTECSFILREIESRGWQQNIVPPLTNR
jgi:hypothetical protein